MPSDPVHKVPEDVAMEGPGQELPPGLPPRPGAGQEAQAQPRTEELVVKAFWNGLRYTFQKKFKMYFQAILIIQGILSFRLKIGGGKTQMQRMLHFIWIFWRIFG